MALHNTNNKSKAAPKFLHSLYDMLHYEDQTILAWSLDGTYFQVFDVQRLEREVLAKYFKHNKFSSFQRQLNNFGFRKWTKTRANVCTFSHDVLRRCPPDKLAAMVRDSEAIMAARTAYLESASAKRTRSESDMGALVTDSTKRLCLEPHPAPAEIGYIDGIEPEPAPPFYDTSEGSQYLLAGFKQIDLCDLDWSLVTDQGREDDLLALVAPLMNEPAPPVTTVSEPSPAGISQLPPIDANLFDGSEWWVDVIDKMVTDC